MICFLLLLFRLHTKASLLVPLFSQGRLRSLPNSISFTFPKVVNISSRCSENREIIVINQIIFAILNGGENINTSTSKIITREQI